MNNSKKLLIGNWKMNGDRESIDLLLQTFVPAVEACSRIEWVLCAPFVYLSQLQNGLSATSVAWGAQDMSAYDSGAHTGEISVSMLSDFSCRYVILGHSERRQHCGESNELVAQKYVKACQSTVTPVLCVGETLLQRENGEARSIVYAQLNSVLEACREQSLSLNSMVIAYEPVWAIGTGVHAKPSDVEEMHRAIHERLLQVDAVLAQSSRLLYGGSVKPDNAEALIAVDHVDGFLVGGASLDSQFLEIGDLCNQSS